MGRQTGSRWGRDEDGAREQRGGPRLPGSRKTALGRSGGREMGVSILKLGGAEGIEERGGGGAVVPAPAAAWRGGGPPRMRRRAVWAPPGQKPQ